ncbi:MAG TPA: threonine--tRNA ligase, partial [Desulfobacterales bacterium]|nr:threonine--tRNA ligase [Desulfobacterales bacterium]
MKTYKVSLKGQNPQIIQAESLTAREALKELKVKRLDEVIAVRFNGTICDLNVLLDGDADLEPIYVNSPEGLEILRHSTSHVMA